MIIYIYKDGDKMLKSVKQMGLSFSKYNDLYDILIDKDNLFREIKEKVDFTFVYEELKDNYSSTMGRTSEDVVRMFKYLLLKACYKISDRELIRRTRVDVEFKYFLDYDIEELNFIDPSLLTFIIEILFS